MLALQGYYDGETIQLLEKIRKPDLKEQEKTAWEKAVTERYGNA